MKILIFPFFSLLFFHTAYYAQVSDCVVDHVFEAYFEDVTVGAVDVPEGAVLNWSVNGEMMNNGSDTIDLSLEIFLNGPVTVCVSVVSDECPEGVENCETLDSNDLIESDCIDIDIIDLTALCSFLYAPVCGCNGVTYSNECVAVNYSGVTEWTDGECEEGSDCPEIIGSMNQSTDFCHWIFEVEGSVDGAEVTWNFGDASNEVFGDIADHHYAADGEYVVTAYYSDVSCEGVLLTTAISVDGCSGEVDCIDQDQIDNEMFCTEQYDPVCGCDEVTYSNECHAYYYGGVTSWVDGECTNSVSDINGNQSWSVFPVPTSDLVTFKGLYVGTNFLKIYDHQGRIVKEASVSNGETISLNALINGWYTMQIVGIESSAKRVIIQR